VATLTGRQNGTLSFSTADSTLPVTVSSYTASQSILWFSLRGGYNQPDSYAFRGVKTNSTTLTFTRPNNELTATIEWELLEFDTDVDVQDFEVNVQQSSTTSITTVTVAQSWVVHTGRSRAGSQFGSDDPYSAWLSAADTVSYGIGTATSALTSIQVVDYTGVDVQNFQSTFSGTNLSFTVAPSSVDTTATMLSGGASLASNAGMDGYLFRLALTSATLVTADRGATDDESLIYVIDVVEFTDGTSVQDGPISIGTSEYLGTATITDVTIANTVSGITAMMPWSMTAGKSTETDDDSATSWFTVTMTAVDTVTATRVGIGFTCDLQYCVVEFFTGAADVNVNVPAGTLQLTGYAPTVATPVNVNVPKGTLNLTGYAPTVVVDTNIDVPVATLSLTGYAPTVQTPVDVPVPAGTLNLTGYAPTVATPVNVDVPAGTLQLTGYAPTVAVTENVVVDVPLGTLNLTGLIPTVQTPVDVPIPAGTLNLTGYAPTVAVTENINVAVPKGTINLTGYAPSVYVGTTYYVDFTTGNDGDDGLSEVDAWKTISKVNGETFNPGDQILFKRGEVWGETLNVNQNGAEDAPITYKDFGSGNLPKITGADGVSTWTLDSGNIYVASLVYAGTLYLLLEDGVPLLPVASKAAITSAGKFWFDDTNDDIYCWATDGADPDTHTMEAGVRYNTVVVHNRSYIHLENLNVEGGGGQFGRGIAIGSDSAASAHITVEGCTVSGCFYTGIWVNTNASQTAVDNVTVSNTTVQNCAGVGLRLNGENAGNRATNLVVSGCTIRDCGVDQTTYGEHGLYLAYCDSAVVTTTTVQDCQGKFAWGGGLYVDNCPGIEVSRCWFSGNDPHNCNLDVASNGFSFHYNISKDSPGVGLVVEEHEELDGDSFIYNNVFYDNDIGLRYGPGGTVFEVRSVTVRNNIFSENSSHNVSLPANSIHSSNDFDYNIYYYTGSNEEFNEVGVDWYTFSEWLTRTAALSWDGNSFSADPIFIDRANDDFRPFYTSDAVEGGTDVGLDVDYTGKAVPQGTFEDIGAYEYSGVAVEVPAGTLNLTGYAPTVETPVNVDVPAGTLQLTGYAPTVATPVNVDVPKGTLNLTGYAPTIEVSGAVEVQVPAGTLNLTGYAPTVAVSENVNVDVPKGTLNLTGHAPTVATPVNVDVPTGTLNLTGYAPTIQTPVTVAIPAGALNLTGYAPTVATPVNVDVPTGTLNLTGYAPTIQTPVTVAIPAGALNLTGYAPTVTVSGNVEISVPAGTLNLTGYAPTATVSENVEVSVPAGTLQLTGYAPTVAVSDNVNVGVPAGTLQLTGYAPTVETPVNVDVPAGTLQLTGYAPTVLVPVTVSIPLGTLQLTAYAPEVYWSQEVIQTAGIASAEAFETNHVIAIVAPPAVSKERVRGFEHNAWIQY